MRFKSIDVCVNCEEQLNSAQQMYSNGTCTHCGYTVDGTICDTKKIVLMKVYESPWWNIFGKDIWERQ
jgi:hypothetical protein